MALVLLDRARETTAVVGTTASAILLGAAPGYQSLAGVGNGNTTYYCISDQGGANWEVGIGTYTSAGTTLARTTVLASSNAGALVVFTAGVKDVFVTYPSEKGVWYDASGNVLFTGTTTAANLAYTGTLTGSTSILSIGSGQIYKDASGNVGIGNIPSGTYKLEVSGSIGSTSSTNPNLMAVSSSTTGIPNLNLQNATTNWQLRTEGSSGAFTIFNTSAERIRIDSSGNVLVGTTSNTSTVGTAIRYGFDASSTIFVGKNNAPANANWMELAGGGATRAVLAWDTTGGGAWFGSTAAYPVSFYTNNTERMRIDSAGNVGIGNIPSGTYKLEVTGAIGASTTVTAPELLASNGFMLNNKTVSASYTFPAGYNAVSVGAVTINSGVVVTVPSTQRWVVL